jgi:hypothetical protein
VPNFVAFFPSTEAAQPPTAAFSALERIFRGPLRADDVRTNVLRGATLLRTRSAGMSPRFYASEDGAGWIVVKGQIFDMRSETPSSIWKNSCSASSRGFGDSQPLRGHLRAGGVGRAKGAGLGAQRSGIDAQLL